MNIQLGDSFKSKPSDTIWIVIDKTEQQVVLRSRCCEGLKTINLTTLNNLLESGIYQKVEDLCKEMSRHKDRDIHAFVSIVLVGIMFIIGLIHIMA